MNYPPFATPRPSIRALVPSRRDMGSVLRLALPVAGVQVGMMLMGVVDTVMVGRVSAAHLAAAALGNVYFFAVTCFGMGVLMSLDPLVSQALGAGDDRAVARSVQRGLLLSVGLTVLASVMTVPAEVLLALARQPDEVVPLAARYALACIPGMLPYFGFIVLRQTLQAMGRMRPIVITIVVANVANVFLNWILIFGKLGFPAMGAVGSGWASSISRWVMGVILLGAGWPLLRRHLRPFHRESFAPAPLLRMVGLGAPIGFQILLEFGAFGTAGLLMGLMGTVAVAAHQVALNLASLTFMVPLGVAQATAVLVGRAVGRGDAGEARRAAGGGILLGAGFMTLTALAFLLFPSFWGRLYTSEMEVVALAATLLPIAGLFQVMDGLQVVSAGTLRGVGDTRGPMILNLVGFWVLGMPVAIFLGFRAGLGPAGLWWGLAAGLGAVAVLLLFRVRSRLGRDLTRVVIEADEGVEPVLAPAP
jgi:multidrug resistance protein, MATE family